MLYCFFWIFNYIQYCLCYIYMILDDFGGTPPLFSEKKYIYIYTSLVHPDLNFLPVFLCFSGSRYAYTYLYIYIYIIWINKEINKFTPSIGPVSKTVSKSQRFSRSPQVERIPRFGSTGCEPFEHLYEALGILGSLGREKNWAMRSSKAGKMCAQKWCNIIYRLYSVHHIYIYIYIPYV